MAVFTVLFTTCFEMFVPVGFRNLYPRNIGRTEWGCARASDVLRTRRRGLSVAHRHKDEFWLHFYTLKKACLLGEVGWYPPGTFLTVGYISLAIHFIRTSSLGLDSPILLLVLELSCTISLQSPSQSFSTWMCTVTLDQHIV